jgi:3-carboxy-cis,cis-muconate cycloisomerase
MRAAVSDVAWLRRMLDFEGALARVEARLGVIPEAAGEAIAARCHVRFFDIEQLGREARGSAGPVVPLVRALTAVVPGDAARHVHWGATSQDVLDTAAMLLARDALDLLLADLDRVAAACARLAEEHRDTVMVARTLLQQALPTTFGFKAAGWLVGLDGARAELVDVRERSLALQLGGAVGTLAALGDHGLEVAADVADQLGLAQPELPWHTLRLRPARLASALGAALGVMGKLARDVSLLAQTEVAEATEGGEGRGGSSTMPHKHNPVGAVAVVACAKRGPGLLATIFSAMVQEHERAAGAWQAEWEPLLELLRITGSAASATRELLAGLEIDARKMRGDLELSGGLLMSESVATALAKSLGRAAAQELVERAARECVQERRPLREVLLSTPEISQALGPVGVDEALDPEQYLGVSNRLIERALAAYRGAR